MRIPPCGARNYQCPALRPRPGVKWRVDGARPPQRCPNRQRSTLGARFGCMRSSSATGDLACAVTRWLPVSPSAHVPGREVPKSSGARLRPLRAHGAAPAAPEALAGSVLVLCRTLAPWARVHLGRVSGLAGAARPPSANCRRPWFSSQGSRREFLAFQPHTCSIYALRPSLGLVH